MLYVPFCFQCRDRQQGSGRPAEQRNDFYILHWKQKKQKSTCVLLAGHRNSVLTQEYCHFSVHFCVFENKRHKKSWKRHNLSVLTPDFRVWLKSRSVFCGFLLSVRMCSSMFCVRVRETWWNTWLYWCNIALRQSQRRRMGSDMETGARKCFTHSKLAAVCPPAEWERHDEILRFADVTSLCVRASSRQWDPTWRPATALWLEMALRMARSLCEDMFCP